MNDVDLKTNQTDFQSIKSGVEYITPDSAKEYLKSNTLNRPLNSRMVEFYASSMKRGQWELNGEPIIIARSGRVLDGQHRLQAVIESGIPINFFVTRGISDNTFDTIDQGKSRTGGDILAITGVSQANRKSAAISRYNSLRVSMIITETKNRDKENKFTKRDILNEYNRVPHFWDNVVAEANKCYDSKRLFSNSDMAGVMAFLILDRSHSEDTVFGFFRQLTGIDDPQNNTIILLSNKIIDASLKGYKLTSKYKTALLIKAFNAYLTGKEYKVLTYNEGIESYPIFI